METSGSNNFLFDVETAFGEANFYKTVITKSNVLIHIDDLDTKKMLWGGGNFKEILGFSAEEIRDMGIHYLSKYYHPDDFKKTIETINYFKQDKGERHTTLFKLKHKNGEWIYLYTTRSLFKRKPDGEPWLVLSFSMDVTSPVHAGSQIEQLLKENLKLKSKLLANTFTKKELEILLLLCKGCSSIEIGKRLFISPKTVDKHRFNIKQKANCKNTPQLLNFAIDNGLM
jgi:PAS domain S-box-containing protein